jgi:hypothetical protein
MHMIKKAIYLNIKIFFKKNLNASIVHLSNKTHSIELIALNLTCTKKESHCILTE